MDPKIYLIFSLLIISCSSMTMKEEMPFFGNEDDNNSDVGSGTSDDVIFTSPSASTNLQPTPSQYKELCDTGKKQGIDWQNNPLRTLLLSSELSETDIYDIEIYCSSICVGDWENCKITNVSGKCNVKDSMLNIKIEVKGIFMENLLINYVALHYYKSPIMNLRDLIVLTRIDKNTYWLQYDNITLLDPKALQLVMSPCYLCERKDFVCTISTEVTVLPLDCSLIDFVHIYLEERYLLALWVYILLCVRIFLVARLLESYQCFTLESSSGWKLFAKLMGVMIVSVITVCIATGDIYAIYKFLLQNGVS
ncbi:membrane protein S32 [Saimiriine betaherpesvirus 4]|uniref:Membrane protein S32 n=1 Tax=Saimiriine betaherpesvirus 4 TaxID=1535247 RepID=G8XT58_9BETA|nr:membrane protein S32 [Saimiriine betaherpesvirus 4]AEV81007.1 membrane protein S32 [Saimiriine betaherpesvirus 4]